MYIYKLSVVFCLFVDDSFIKLNHKVSITLHGLIYKHTCPDLHICVTHCQQNGWVTNKQHKTEKHMIEINERVKQDKHNKNKLNNKTNKQ